MLNIYFTNDVHSNVPHSIDLWEKLYFLKKEDSIVIDLGDFFEGRPFYNMFNAEPEKKLFNKIYDVAIPGNHGLAELLELKKNTSSIKFLNCNIFNKNKNLLFEESFICEKNNNVKIAFLGIMSLDSFYSIEEKSRKGLTIVDPYNVLKKLIPRLAKEVDRIILLSHSGFLFDINLARCFKEIDLIISSHCHTNSVYQHVGNSLVVQGYDLAQGYGHICIGDEIDKVSLRLVENKHDFFKGGDLIFLNKYLKNYYQKFDKEVFFISKKFTNKYNTRKKIMALLVNFIKNYYKADVCFINYHCLRTNLRMGINTLEDIYCLIPFDNYLTRFILNKNDFYKIYNKIGAEMKEFICCSVNKNDKKNISVITSSYLFENIVNINKNIQDRRIILLRDFIIRNLNYII